MTGALSSRANSWFGFGGGDVKWMMRAVATTTPDQIKARLLSIPRKEISPQGIPSQPVAPVSGPFKVSAAPPADGLLSPPFPGSPFAGSPVSNGRSGSSIRRSATSSTRALRSSSSFSCGSPCNVLSRVQFLQQ